MELAAIAGGTDRVHGRVIDPEPNRHSVDRKSCDELLSGKERSVPLERYIDPAETAGDALEGDIFHAEELAARKFDDDGLDSGRQIPEGEHGVIQRDASLREEADRLIEIELRQVQIEGGPRPEPRVILEVEHQAEVTG